MKKLITLCLLMLTAFLSNAQNYLSGPQKIVIDTEHNRYLVSNFNTGNIAQIDSVGNLDNWIPGANFVDGLEIVGNVVYGVGNNRNVRGYDLTTKQLVLDTTLEGSNSNYLSSITYDSLGHLMISCPALHTIYRLRISDGAYWIFAENNGLNRPNGILLEKENDRIVVIDDSPSTSIIHAISLSDSSVSNLMTNNFNNPDGITRDKYGYYYIGGYYLPGLYKINPDFSGEPDMFFAGSHMIYPTYNEAHHSLLITYYGLNDWGEVFLDPTNTSSPKLYNTSALLQIFPNPFADYTNIQFELKNNTHVRIKVLDSSGRTINTLVNEKKQAGIYKTFWNGKNKSGQKVSNGTYYFRLTVNGYTETQSILLLK